LLPLRSVLALGAVAVLAGLIVWLAVLAIRPRSRPTAERVALVGAIVALTAVVLWIVFILPVYWD
jgi:hypothetical protein